MKLLELIDLERTRKTKVSTDPWTFPEKMAGGKKHIGHGISSVAFPSKKPNTILKTSYHESSNDPYFQYLKLVLDNQDNPFFPRIYNAKTYEHTTRKGRPVVALVVEMEKLISPRHPKMRDTMPHLYEQVGLNYSVDQRDEWNNPTFIKKVQQKTTNPKFAEALQLLSPYFNKFKSDLHRKNIMVRLTGSGPQLVVTDPFMPSELVYQTRGSETHYSDDSAPQDQTGYVTPVA